MIGETIQLGLHYKSNLAALLERDAKLLNSIQVREISLTPVLNLSQARAQIDLFEQELRSRLLPLHARLEPLRQPSATPGQPPPATATNPVDLQILPPTPAEIARALAPLPDTHPVKVQPVVNPAAQPGLPAKHPVTTPPAAQIPVRFTPPTPAEVDRALAPLPDTHPIKVQPVVDTTAKPIVAPTTQQTRVTPDTPPAQLSVPVHPVAPRPDEIARALAPLPDTHPVKVQPVVDPTAKLPPPPKPPRDHIDRALADLPESHIIKIVSRFDDAGQEEMRRVTRQTQRGVQDIREEITGLGRVEIDTRPLEDFRQKVEAIQSRLKTTEALPRGKGAVEERKRILLQEAAELQKVLNDTRADQPGVAASPAFRAAERQLDTLIAKSAQLEGAGARDIVDRQLRDIARQTQEREKQLLLERESAKNLADQAQRQAALAEIERRRRDNLTSGVNRLANMEDQLISEGRTPDAERSSRRRAVLVNTRNQLDLESAREAERGAGADAERALQREIEGVNQDLRRQLQLLDQREAALLRQARSSLRAVLPGVAPVSPVVSQETRRVREERQVVLTTAQSRLSDIGARAENAGFTTVADKAFRQQAPVARELTATHEKLADAANRSGHAFDFHGRSMLRNAAVAVTWLAPMQVLFSVINALAAGLNAVVSVDRQFATLQSVFRGTAEEAQRLRDDVISIGVAQGQSSKDAIDAAIRFSRLGLTRSQAAKATETALIAQNVAEISGGEAAEFLAATMSSYKLTVDQLSLALGGLNAISNTYNVTNKDLIGGIERTAGLAKQAGLSFTQLAGTIGAAAGATGRPGPEIGNALKFIITRVRRPDTLDKLEKDFDVNLRLPDGEIKNFDEILKQLAQTYRVLNKSQQAAFLDLVAGAHQASRAAGFFDNYTQSQILAARAARDVDSAVQENRKIVSSLENQIRSLTTAWEQLFVAAGDAFLVDALRGGISLAQDLVDTLKEGADLIGRLTGAPAGAGEQRRIELSDRDLIKAFNTAIDFQDVTKDLDFGDVANSFFGVKKTRATIPQLEQFREALAKSGRNDLVAKIDLILGQDDSRRASQSIDDVAGRIARLRSQIDGLKSSANVFDDLGKRAARPGEDLGGVLRDLESAADSLDSLDPSGARSSRLQLTARELTGLAPADALAKVSQIAADLGREFREKFNSESAGFGAKQAEAIRQLEKQVRDVRARENKVGLALDVELTKPFEQQDLGQIQRLREETKQLRDEGKDAADSLAGIKAALDGGKEKVDEIAARVERFTTLAKTLGVALGEAVGKFRPEGDADESGARVLAQRGLNTRLQTSVFAGQEARAQAALKAEQDTLAQQIRNDQIQSEALKASVRRSTGSASPFAPGGPSVGEEEIAAIDKASAERQRKLSEASAKTQEALQQEIDGVRQKRQELANELAAEDPKFAAEAAAADLRAALERGARDIRLVATEASFGPNEGIELINRQRALQEQLSRGAGFQSGAGVSPARSEGVPPSDTKTALQTARELGAVLQTQAGLQSGVNRLEERRAEVLARIRDTAHEEVNALQKRNTELAKSLALASREDQVRAAVSARVLQQRGGQIGLDEFSFLGEQTRGTIARFLPSTVRAPDGSTPLDDTAEEIRRNRQDLANELGQINSTLPLFASNLLTANERVNAFLANNPLPDAVTRGVTREPTDKTSPVTNVEVGLRLGDVRIDLSEKFDSAVRGTVERVTSALAGELINVKNTLSRLQQTAIFNGIGDQVILSGGQ